MSAPGSNAPSDVRAEAVPCQGMDRQGMVFDIQRMSIHDGPGIRTTVFLKGCPMNCLWCHNPEGRQKRPELAFTPALCIGCGFCFQRCPHGCHVMENGVHTLYREDCAECFACAAECYANALEITGREMAVTEVLAEVEKDRVFYDESNGGLTLSGGEPLAQRVFAAALLEQARGRGIHTCVETCGCVPPDALRAVMADVDLFLFDWKESDPERHKACTGQDNALILDNLRMLDEAGCPIILRCPIVPGVNLRDGHLQGIAALAKSLAHCRAVHVMGHHALGEGKRERLGLPKETAPCPTMERAEVDSVVERLRALGAAHVEAG